MSAPLVNVKMQERKRDREKLRLRQTVSDMEAVLSTPQGRRFVWNIITDLCAYEKDFPTGPDGIKTLGRRAVAVDLLNNIRALAPAAYAALKRSAVETEVEEDIHRNDADMEPSNA